MSDANLNPFEPQSRFGDKPVKFQVLCTPNGTAVPKGLRITHFMLLCTNMLECLLGVLEEGLVMPRATSTAAVSVAGAGRARGAGGAGSGKSQSQPQSSGEKYVRCTR